MSFLLRPMIWYKFIGGMVALKGKYCFSSFPQPCLQMHITAFPNGAGHLSALWRTKRVARMWGCYIQLQQEAALRQTDMFRGKCLNFDAFVGCQTILPALVHDRADASAEGTSAKGDMDIHRRLPWAALVCVKRRRQEPYRGIFRRILIKQRVIHYRDLIIGHVDSLMVNFEQRGLSHMAAGAYHADAISGVSPGHLP